MKLKDIINTLNELAPMQYSEAWDNPGLLIGDEEKEICKVYVAVDATTDVIEAAHEAGADLILTHHPLIFHPIRQVSTDSYVGGRIMKIISYGMSLFVMHTDFDVTCMGTEAASLLGLIEIKILEPTFSEELGLGAMGYLKLMKMARSGIYANPKEMVNMHTPAITHMLKDGARKRLKSIWQSWKGAMYDKT